MNIHNFIARKEASFTCLHRCSTRFDLDCVSKLMKKNE